MLDTIYSKTQGMLYSLRVAEASMQETFKIQGGMSALIINLFRGSGLIHIAKLKRIFINPCTGLYHNSFNIA